MWFFRNGHLAWGSISAAIPVFPAILNFVSNIQQQSLKETLYEDFLKALPVAQIHTHFVIWKEMMKYQTDALHLKLKHLEEKDEGAQKTLEDELAVKEGQLNGKKSYLHNYKVPETFGEALPQSVLQIYIVVQQAGSLDKFFDFLDEDYEDNGLMFSTYFSLVSSIISLSLGVTSMAIEYWMEVKGKTTMPTQGLGMTIKIMPLMMPVVLPRMMSFSITLASTDVWWLKLVLFTTNLSVYLFGYLLLLKVFKRWHPEETFENAKDKLVLQVITSLFAPCIWINPRLKLLVYNSLVSGLSHFITLGIVMILSQTCPEYMNKKLTQSHEFQIFIGCLALIILLSCLCTYCQWKIIRRRNFIVACAGNDVKMVKEMLETDAKSKTEDNGQAQGCLGSITRKLTSLKLKMRPELNFNECDKFGQTGLHEAAFAKHDDIVFMIASHAQQLQINLDFKDTKGLTGLGKYFRKVCEAGDLKNLEKILTFTTIDFNEPDENGQSGFYYTCWKGHVQAVKLLVQRSKSLNLDLNKANVNGLTAFHMACQEQHEEIVDYLIANSEEFGINLLAEDDEYGHTGYDLWPEKFQS